MNRRMATVGLTAIFAGCAQPQAPRRAAQPPVARFPWGGPIAFNGLAFDFTSARHAGSFNNWLNQTTQGGNFVIIDVTITNTASSPLPMHFQPIFRLTDDSGAMYDSSDIHTAMINMQKPNRGTFGQSINPNTPTRREIVFEAARRPYQILTIVPDRALVAFAGSVESRGPYFFVDARQALS